MFAFVAKSSAFAAKSSATELITASKLIFGSFGGRGVPGPDYGV